MLTACIYRWLVCHSKVYKSDPDFRHLTSTSFYQWSTKNRWKWKFVSLTKWLFSEFFHLQNTILIDSIEFSVKGGYVHEWWSQPYRELQQHPRRFKFWRKKNVASLFDENSNYFCSFFLLLKNKVRNGKLFSDVINRTGFQ